MGEEPKWLKLWSIFYLSLLIKTWVNDQNDVCGFCVSAPLRLEEVIRTWELIGFDIL